MNLACLPAAIALLCGGLAVTEDRRFHPDVAGLLRVDGDAPAVDRGESALDVCGGHDKVYLHESPDPANVNHLWTVQPVGEYVMFVSRVDGMALDANAGSGNPYPRAADLTNDNHLWIVTRVGDHVMLWSKVAAVALDANSGRGRPYISSEPDPRNVNHLWELRPVGEDFMLVPKVRRSDAAAISKAAPIAIDR